MQLGHLHASNITAEMHALNNDAEALMSRLAMVREARSLYTYEGVLHQLELFFRNPFGNSITTAAAAVSMKATRGGGISSSSIVSDDSDGGLLRCAPLPLKDHRRYA